MADVEDALMSSFPGSDGIKPEETSGRSVQDLKDSSSDDPCAWLLLDRRARGSGFMSFSVEASVCSSYLLSLDVSIRAKASVSFL